MYDRRRHNKHQRREPQSLFQMDPDCAICHAPATMACDCEAKGLEIAVRQAEARMMQSIYTDIREWVRAHAQDYILAYFRLLTARRQEAHAQHLERITAHAYHYFNQPPHPNEIANAQVQLKKGIDEDWRASVQRYPEVLEYYYNLVELMLPDDHDPAVRDPPLSAMNGARKAGRRGFVTSAGPSTVASGPGPGPGLGLGIDVSRRTPPGPIDAVRGDRRASAPRDRRHSSYRAPPAPSTYYSTNF